MQASTVSSSQPGFECSLQQSPLHEPHWSDSPAQILSQLLVQQKGSRAHTHLVTAGSLHPFWSCARQQPLAEQGPQSAGQFSQCSPASHLASPQAAGQAPQSAGQFLQSSPASHFWLPHCTAPHSPHLRPVTSLTQIPSHAVSQQ